MEEAIGRLMRFRVTWAMAAVNPLELNTVLDEITVQSDSVMEVLNYIAESSRGLDDHQRYLRRRATSFSIVHVRE